MDQMKQSGTLEEKGISTASPLTPSQFFFSSGVYKEPCLSLLTWQILSQVNPNVIDFG